MRRKVFLILVFICLIVLGIQLGKQILPEVFGIIPKGGLKVTSFPEATVYLNGLEVGKTPFREDNLDIGEYLVKLISPDSIWQGKIKLNKGTLSVINRSLTPTDSSSSGESLVLESGNGAIITSNPSNSEIELDGKKIGKTPLSLSSLTSGSHSFSIYHDNYVIRKVDVVLPANLSLHINVDLALAEVKTAKIVTPTEVVAKKIKIKQTPLGYLKVREKPSISSKELGQVSSGEELEVVSEVTGWIKIKLKNNVEGYVSVQYIQRLN